MNVRVLATALCVYGVVLAGCDDGDDETAPSITSQPADQAATEGDDVVFTVGASGSATLSFQWRRDGVDMPKATQATLRVFAAHLDLDGTDYSCVVANAHGSVVSDPATLSVSMGLPFFQQHPRSVTVAVGQAADFEVFVGGSGTLSVQWQRDTVDITSATSAAYSIASTVPGDDGASFRCVVTNAAGSVASAAATLSVDTVQITTLSAPAAVSGVAYTYQLEGTGGTTPYTWMLTSGTFPAGLTLGTDGVISGTSSAVGSATVTVQLTDNAAATKTADIAVAVAESVPVIAIDPPHDYGNVWGVLGDPVDVQFTVTGGTAPFTWSIVYGVLPEGLSQDAATGQITGTPTVGVSSGMLMHVVDDAGLSNMAALTFTLSPNTVESPRIVQRIEAYENGQTYRGYVVGSSSPIASVTVDVQFASATYPVRVKAFTPPDLPMFVSMAALLDADEEFWELPKLGADSYLGRTTVTDSQGRVSVDLTEGVVLGWGGWPAFDADGDGVPDTCDETDGEDPSAVVVIHRDVANRLADDAQDVLPPELVSVLPWTAGPPGARGDHRTYVVSDASFIAGGEVEVVFTDASPTQTVMVPLVFQNVTQSSGALASSITRTEGWALPFIPANHYVGGVRIWDRWGNTLESGFGFYQALSIWQNPVAPTTDTEPDGIDDDWEQHFFATVDDCVPGEDSDLDTFDNATEYLFLSNPMDPDSVPVTADADGDDVPDRFDPDNPDSIVNTHQHLADAQLTNYDSDGDGMPDIWENTHVLTDAAGDPDGDLQSNLDEFRNGNNPRLADSDGDGTADGADGPRALGTALWGGTLCVCDAAGQTLSYDATYGYPAGGIVVFQQEAPHGIAWVKVMIRLASNDEWTLVDAVLSPDPALYGLWYAAPGTVWQTPPIGAHFFAEGLVVCDNEGAVVVVK